jgi:hypothetical protein
MRFPQTRSEPGRRGDLHCDSVVADAGGDLVVIRRQWLAPRILKVTCLLEDHTAEESDHCSDRGNECSTMDVKHCLFPDCEKKLV